MSLRVLFWRSDKVRERFLADAFVAGVKTCGDDAAETPLLAEYPETLPACDIACMVGVKSRRLYQAHWKAGIHTLYMDKGYVRTEARGPVKAWKYWRVALDGHHPTRYMQDMRFDARRWAALNLRTAPWRKSGSHIVLAGSSEKYHEFYELKHPTDYNQQIVKRIQGLSDRPIVYRPKPSWEEATPIRGTQFSSGGTIHDVLPGAHALVTHGSNAVFEAVLAGVPTLVLGDAVTKDISSTAIEDIEAPRMASDDDRARWAHALAYCQWTVEEMRSGEAWTHIKREFQRQCV